MKRLIGVALALGLSACAQGNLSSSSLFTQSTPRPEAVVVTDVDLGSDVVLLDPGFSARLQRKTANMAPHVIREQLNERVRQEIVFSLIAGLRDAGMQASEGSEETTSLSQPSLIVAARVRGNGQAASRGQRSLFSSAAGAKSQVAADVELSFFSSGGKKPATTFVAEPDAKAKIGGNISGITMPEKLSPEVEAAARRIGRGIARKIVDYAREKDWIAKSEAPEPKPAPAPAKKPPKNPDPDKQDS
ncbi:MAG: hypothetical protein WCG92_17550 [Hyphomicrobiales bacterium]